MTLEHRTGPEATPDLRGRPGTRPLARVAPVRTPGLLAGPPETSGPIPVAAPGAHRTGALLAGTDGRGPATAVAGVALAPARPVTTARAADDKDTAAVVDKAVKAVGRTNSPPPRPPPGRPRVRSRSAATKTR